MTKTRFPAVVLAFAIGALLVLSAAPAAGADGLDRLLAPASTCPDQTDLGAPASTQERAMLCMTNFARTRTGRPPLRSSRQLVRAAAGKSGDILRCDEFSHEACGREFTYWMSRYGYLGAGGCWGAAENIAWGTGSLATVRGIFRAWLHSSGHRENLLGPYAQIGIGLRVGTLEGNRAAHVWTQEFGTHHC